MSFAKDFCDSMEWHHRKWWGFNVAQSRWSFNAQVNFWGALICATTGNIFLQLIGILFLVAAVWCCVLAYQLRTQNTDSATPRRTK